mmetsp:Transcript_7416/g.18178  ORF Transcript_7416/g.18178 Transcript_7416/m.18178 type:complete len:233 (-) Transcript_7416:305-1003(-)
MERVGVSMTAKKGCSNPFSDIMSMTCLLSSLPWINSTRACKGRPSVSNMTWMDSTVSSNWKDSTPLHPWTTKASPSSERAWTTAPCPACLFPPALASSTSATTQAPMANSMGLMLRTAIELCLLGVSKTAEKGKVFPSSLATWRRIGVDSGPCQTSTVAERGTPSLLSMTETRSMLSFMMFQVLRHFPPWTFLTLSVPAREAKAPRTAPKFLGLRASWAALRSNFLRPPMTG